MVTINLYTIIIVVSFVVVASLLFEYVVRWFKKSFKVTNGIGRKAVMILRIIFYSFIVLVAFGVMGINLVGLLAGAGFLGIIIGLAVQQPLGNAFGGIYIGISRLVKEGDYIRINAIGSNIMTSGKVIHIGFSHTELLDDNSIIKFIPNNLMITSILERGTSETNKNN